MNVSTAALPGYLAGTWTISPVNSDVSFTVRHLGVTTVHGRFNDVTGAIVTGDPLERSWVTAVIAADSIDTGFPARDSYLKGSDVLAAGEHKELRFESAGVRVADGGVRVDGGLTIRGVSSPVSLAVELGGFGEDPTGRQQVLGLSATVTLHRADFGFSPDIPSLIIGEDISVRLDLHAVLDA